MHFVMMLLAATTILTACNETAKAEPQDQRFTVEVWADNWFEMYANGSVIATDSVPITTERSFNAETATFEIELPAQIAFIAKDFKENDTGLEYIGTPRQQIGDGGIIAQIKNTATGQIVAVTDEQVKCMVVHHAPLEKSCAKETNPTVGQGACASKVIDIPQGWKEAQFDDSAWANAKAHSEQAVRPKGGYDEINWDASAKLIWGDDLELDNTLLCRFTLSSSDDRASNEVVPAPDIDIAERCNAITQSVEAAGFADTVKIECNEGHAYLFSDSYPDHSLMTGIVGTNEQIPVPASDYFAPVRLEPKLSDTPITRDASLGVAVNGVPIFDYTGGGEMSIEELHHHQTQHDTILTQQLDICGGHAGRGDDYHYHKRPNCMIDVMDNAGDDAIIGWAFDGFPIYGDRNPDGTEIEPDTLDVCNGQADDTYGYRYHTSANAPYIIQCLMGEAMNAKDLPRIAPLRAATGSAEKTTGRPPRGGVENLIFAQDSDGKRTMTYSYKGEDYYMSYEPSQTPNCYNFKTKTITDGAVKTGEYCR